MRFSLNTFQEKKVLTGKSGLWLYPISLFAIFFTSQLILTVCCWINDISCILARKECKECATTGPAIPDTRCTYIYNTYFIRIIILVYLYCPVFLECSSSWWSHHKSYFGIFHSFVIFYSPLMNQMNFALSQQSIH